MPPAKRAAPKRPTTAKPKPQTFAERRAALIAEREATQVFEWEGYDRTWHIQRPNPMLIANLESTDSVAAITDYLLGHVIEDERDDFYAALLADDAMDYDLLGLITSEFTEIVYAEIPTSPSSAS